MVVHVEPELAGAAGLDVRRLDGVALDALAHADSGVLPFLQTNRGLSYSNPDNTVRPAYKVLGCKVNTLVGSIFGSSQKKPALLFKLYPLGQPGPVLYGQFSVAKTLT